VSVAFVGFRGRCYPIGPDGTLLFHLALIIVMVALLNATLLKPINRILEERERLTKGRLSEAQRTLLIVQEKLLEYERRLREARAEGMRLWSASVLLSLKSGSESWPRSNQKLRM